MTSTMSTWRSNQLSYNPILLRTFNCLTTKIILSYECKKSNTFFEKIQKTFFAAGKKDNPCWLVAKWGIMNSKAAKALGD